MDKFVDGPHVHEYLAEMTREVFAGRDGEFITIGEMPGVTPEQARLYTDPARGELNMVFQFEHVSVDQGPAGKFDYVGLDLVVLKRSLHRWQAALAETGWNSLYWNNHDQPRVVSRFGDDHPDYWAASAKALATVLHGMRGTPFVYQGEELGMTNYPFRSPAGPQGPRGRELLPERARSSAATRVRRWPVWPRSAATTPARQCNGTRDRTPASPPAILGCRSTPTTPG